MENQKLKYQRDNVILEDNMGIEFGKTEKVPGDTDLIGSEEKFKAFGRSLAGARIAVGKTQTQVMSELGLKRPGSIYKWETGESFPGEDKLPAIAKVLNINEQELIKNYKALQAIREKVKYARKNPKSIRRKQPDFPASHGWRVR